MVNDSTSLSCIILAGGRGSRVGGADKGLLPYEGRPLIEHVIESVAPQVDDIIISTNRNIVQYRRYSNMVITDGSSIDYLPDPGFTSGVASLLAALWPRERVDRVLLDLDSVAR